MQKPSLPHLSREELALASATAVRAFVDERIAEGARQVLARAGYVAAPPLAAIERFDDLAPGKFAPTECRLGADKCDVAVRLRDRRLLAIECKVSNSYVNSVKRLTHEAGNKAKNWFKAFGDNQFVACAVLSGAFKVDKLAEAQDAGIFVVFQHDLGRLERFVRTARRQ